jgi:K(+)-stimulated pyrophosphate-energized sodium pump
MELLLAVLAGVLALAFAGYSAWYVLGKDEGNERMKEISADIRSSALTFLHREYSILAIVVVVIAAVLLILGINDRFDPMSPWAALTFVFGAACSMTAGYIGMNIAIRSNARTAAAAQKNLNEGLRVSFRGGVVMGMSVVGIGILGLSLIYALAHDLPVKEEFYTIMAAFGMGASCVALFARVGGGIFTKAADTAADLVGKVEVGIPEDDPRNPAVIADCVGDNVGDVAGMGADLFESYVESIIATMTLVAMAVGLGIFLGGNETDGWLLPMMIAAGGIFSSIIGVFLVRTGDKLEMSALLGALRKGTFAASLLTAIIAFIAVLLLTEDNDLSPFWAVLSGLIAGILIGESTNYFTSYEYKPTQNVSEASMSGTGSNIVRGFSTGLLSVFPPFLFVSVAILIAYVVAGYYGVAIAGIGMLSTLGISLATDAYGPVADNSGGIAEMSHLPPEVRERTDALDSLGNTTAATGKGFAIGAAGLTALALMLGYAFQAGIVEMVGTSVAFVGDAATYISILRPEIVVAIFLGIMLPGIFCALTMTSVGKAAELVVEEVRKQFRENKGLMEGTAKPDYSKVVDICTKRSLREMILPSIIAIVAPVIVGLVLGKYALAAFLLGATGSGFLLAVVMANAGGSWDNAKKYIEAGNFGGKGSDAHKAAVVGDTVGDPMKDTSGPSLNIMIKLMSVVALVLAPVFTVTNDGLGWLTNILD